MVGDAGLEFFLNYGFACIDVYSRQILVKGVKARNEVINHHCIEHVRAVLKLDNRAGFVINAVDWYIKLWMRLIKGNSRELYANTLPGWLALVILDPKVEGNSSRNISRVAVFLRTTRTVVVIKAILTVLIGYIDNKGVVQIHFCKSVLSNIHCKCV